MNPNPYQPPEAASDEKLSIAKPSGVWFVQAYLALLTVVLPVIHIAMGKPIWPLVLYVGIGLSGVSALQMQSRVAHVYATALNVLLAALILHMMLSMPLPPPQTDLNSTQYAIGRYIGHYIGTALVALPFSCPPLYLAFGKGPRVYFGWSRRTDDEGRDLGGVTE